MSLSVEEIRRRKAFLRKLALARRDAQPDQEILSETIASRLVALPEFRSSTTLLFYVHHGSEVRTQPLIRQMLDGTQRIFVPYCDGPELKLFRLERWDELAPGTFGILEPKRELRILPERQASIQEIDFVVTPGVAFDPRCGRLGHGRGYYDRLLAHARPETVLVGLAYQCQIFPEVPMLSGDVFLDKVITQENMYIASHVP